MKPITWVLVLLVTSTVYSQSTEKFDVATFSPPAGWKKEVADFAVSYTNTNNITKSWVRATLYKSITSSGDAETDFTSEWNNIVAKNYEGAMMPVAETSSKDGWVIKSGSSSFRFNKEQASVRLISITGYGTEVSVLVLTNSKEYQGDVMRFINSIVLSRPAPITTPPLEIKTQKEITQAASSKNHGITLSTTNFDDGWIAQPFDDWVRVVKGGTTVLLHYAIGMDDELRQSNEFERVLWERLVAPRYQVFNLRQFKNEPYTYNKIYFFEAEVTDKASSKNYHVGFRVIIYNGISRCIEIISKDAATFQQAFPNHEAIERMLNYNKFAVSKADIIGDWTESGGSALQMYNSVTGAYAGMNAVSSADAFTFYDNGTYTSTHKGAMGMVGSQKFYNQEYRGEYTLSNWELSATKRFEGKTDYFWAQFEAVRGGKVLHLTNKSASGVQYHLVKVK